MKELLIAGAGLGGLGAAIACSRAGWQARVFERAPAMDEVGAGIQLGPNATHILQIWGLGRALEEIAWFPQQLIARSADDGAVLGVMELGDAFAKRYGAPYATLHRADLQALLLAGAAGADHVYIHPAARITGFADSAIAATLHMEDGAAIEGDALVGADGLWSTVRAGLLRDGPAQATGHLAYRALVHKQSLPAALRSRIVTAWLGPRLHVVTYPVRRGEWINVVAVVEGAVPGDPAEWSHEAAAVDVRRAVAGACAPLQDWINAIDDWTVWALCDRAPLQGPEQMAHGRVALLGDAAHPMRPYLAQGAAMALEDALALGGALGMSELDVPTALRRYALNRWERNARVQARSRRNGEIFHAQGPLRWGRDLAMKVMGGRVMDMPWLYGG